jgi:hypothetical protein
MFSMEMYRFCLLDSFLARAFQPARSRHSFYLCNAIVESDHQAIGHLKCSSSILEQRKVKGRVHVPGRFMVFSAVEMDR